MTPTKQTVLHDPANGLHGNCLSAVLARHAQAAWDNAHAAYAETAFPLALGARSRVGRLRAYGNAINAAQAEGFIRAVMG